jgi:hypothetical protein
MATYERAPSLVALAAAFKSLELAALQIRGVCDWVEGLGNEQHEFDRDELIRLWAFAERTRDITSGLRQDADELAHSLVRQYVGDDGAWPLTPEQEEEYHEVLATLASREADSHREKLPGQLATDVVEPSTDSEA